MKYKGIVSMSLLGIIPAGLSAQSDRPNILVILADDYGWKDAGFMGSELYQTPNLDRLASGSMIFTDGYSACTVSSPSRASLLTGLYPTAHGITTWIGDPSGTDWRSKGRHNRMLPAEYRHELDTSFVTLPEVLKEYGYSTFMAGKWHLGDKVTPQMQGFDVNKGGWEPGSPKGGYFSPYCNPELEDGPVGENLSERLGRETAMFIQQQAEADRPFFAYLSFYAVHGPLQTTEDLWSKYRRKIDDLGFKEGPAYKVDRLMPVRKYQDNPVYAGLVEQMDNGIGIVLNKIDELGIGDNTIIIFTSDNGGVASGDSHATSNLPLRGGKGRQWEGGIRVPYIIRTPQMQTARLCDVPVSGIDIFPTVLDYAGAEGGEPEGLSLRPLLDRVPDEGSCTALNERPLFWHYPHYGNQGGEPSSIVRKGDWKLIWYHEDGRYELYNLDEDIEEQNALQDKYPEIVNVLKEELHAWLESSDALMPEQDPIWTQEDEQKYLEKAIPQMMAKQEKVRVAMMDPSWQPNSSWWGSKPFSESWKFHLGDLSEASEEQFDDSGWRELDIPHDWAFENGFSPDGAQEDKGGYTSGGIGWYRKHFSLIANEIKDRCVFVDFDAVYMNSEVWVNGHYIGKRPYGYISFSYDITPYIRAGENVMSVRVDNSLEPSARWYHGCGIYGDVRLRYENPLHFVNDGVYVYTPEITDIEASVHVRYDLSLPEKGSKVTAYILQDGRAVSDTISSIRHDKEMKLSIAEPDLWSPDSPSLYQVILKLHDRNGRFVDSENVSIGVREVSWDAEKGFFLNGKQTKLRGVCEHLEGGPVGAAWTEGLLEWKLKLLKDMGCNAIRTAHNPQLPFFYDICDRIGLMVMDEAFDGWARKAEHDYGAQAFAQWWEKDLRAFIRRDRNHPSVVVWSVGNETKGDVAHDLVRVCHEEDPTRAVTSGHSGSEFMDVFGVNGHSERQNFFTTFKPGGKAFVGTETPHTWQVRGFYRTKTWYRDGYPNKTQDPFVIPDLTEKEVFGYDWISPEKRRNVKQIFNSSYDNATVRLTARHNLALLRDMDWYSGHFRWTGFDYLGEAGYVHGGWPFRAFQGGALDLAGFPKDLYYLYQSQWREDIDMVHILPHWTHPDVEEGTLIPVWVYTTGDEAELFLNGRSLGKVEKGQEWNRMQCEWQVPWEKGTLMAVAYKDGKEISRSSVRTADAPTDFKMKIEGNVRKNCSFVTFTQVDDKGEFYPYGDNRVFVAVTNASIVSFENGNPVDVECNWNACSRRSFYGLSRAFLKETGPQGSILVLAGMICGDRSLKTSSKATIRLQEGVVRGKGSWKKYIIRYTTDGTEPDMNSAQYTGPFEVSAGMKVRAKVYCEDSVVLEMEEDFGEGIYWGEPGEKPCRDDGMQAEYMTLDKAVVRNTNGLDVFGAGYVFFRRQGASVSWYQENDMGEHDATLYIRYSQRSAGGKTYLELTNNGKLVEKVEFEDTGSENKDWKLKKVKLKIYPGANAIKLTSLSTEAPSIDSFELH